MKFIVFLVGVLAIVAGLVSFLFVEFSKNTYFFQAILIGLGILIGVIGITVKGAKKK
ncbi:MAG: hypothetical protein QW728_06830 [Thermoplasmata archaeon]